MVDTSNEIGGDGDIPHPAIGQARRMQVAAPELQHEVMIEAVENHMPEVIVIDEIGREQEAAAARTIAERGVQLVGTAHGITLENLLMNPTLSDLVGGIESVTLSDEEARRRGTQKSVLERRAPPTFDVLDRAPGPPAHGRAPRRGRRGRCAAARPVAGTRKSAIATRADRCASRRRAGPPADEVAQASRPRHGPVAVREAATTADTVQARSEARSDAREPAPTASRLHRLESNQACAHLPVRGRARPADAGGPEPGRAGRGGRFAGAGERCGDAEELLPQASAADRRCRAPAHPRLCAARQHDQPDGGVPGRHLRHHSGDGRSGGARHRRDAGGDSPRAGRLSIRGVAIRPSAEIRRMQHEMARSANLVSHSYGNEPRRRVRIFPA